MKKLLSITPEQGMFSKELKTVMINISDQLARDIKLNIGKPGVFLCVANGIVPDAIDLDGIVTILDEDQAVFIEQEATNEMEGYKTQILLNKHNAFIHYSTSEEAMVESLGKTWKLVTSENYPKYADSKEHTEELYKGLNTEHTYDKLSTLSDLELGKIIEEYLEEGVETEDDEEKIIKNDMDTIENLFSEVNTTKH